MDEDMDFEAGGSTQQPPIGQQYNVPPSNHFDDGRKML